MAASRGKASTSSSSTRLGAAFPTLILRRPPKILQEVSNIAGRIESLVQTVTRTAGKLNESFASIFKDKKSEKQKPADKDVTKANVETVQLMLEKMRDELTGMMQSGIRLSVVEMANMGPEQQQELIIFWQQIAELVNELLAWFDRMMDATVTRLVDGYRVDSAEMERIFEQAVGELNRVLREGAPVPT